MTTYRWAVLRRLALLVVLWLALWGDLSVANVLSGLAVGIAIMWVTPPRRTTPHLAFRPIALLRLVWVFVKALVVGSLSVAREVLRPTPRVNDGIVAVRMRTESPFTTAMVSALISLVPGTLTLATEGPPKAFYIHVFNLTDVDAVAAEVHYYEDIVEAAFGLVSEGPETRDLGGDRATVTSGPEWSWDNENYG